MRLSRVKKLYIALICLIAVLLVGLSGTLAWYGNDKVDLPQVEGSVTYMAQYFQSGDGTKDTPYEIATADQFYNLAWLQYLGYFNEPDDDGNIPTTYFYLSANLDMSGYVLPPIGTQDNPFLGNFDGCGHTVSGLTVTNKTVDTDTPIKDLPYSITMGNTDYEDEIIQGVEIIGLFGVVGALLDDTYSYVSSTNEIKNLYIDSLTVKTQTEKSLIGIAAGYVNGTVEKVGVIGDTTISIAATSPLSDYTNNMSDFSLVGYCTEKYRSQVNDVASETMKDSLGGSSSGDGGFGNSIAMKDLFERVYTITGDNTNYPYNVSFNSSVYTSYVSAETRTYEYEGGKLTNVALDLTITQIGSETKDHKYYSFGVGGSYFMRKSSSSLLYMCGYRDTYGSDSFSKTKTVTIIETHDGVETSRTTTEETAKNGRLCYFPINAAWEGNSIVVNPNNTGYFVGGAYNSAYGDMGIEKDALSSISNALGENTTSFADANLQIITRTKDSGDFCLIDDYYNGEASDTLKNLVGTDSNGDVYVKSVEKLGLKRYFTEYENGIPTKGARVNFGTMLSSNSVYGIDFMKVSISLSRIIAAPIVSLYGTTYRDYQMPEDCIDFRLAQSGYVSFFAADLFSGNARNFFSLHEITRDGNKITDIKEIKKIYQKGSSYIYTYDDATAAPEGAELVFDLKWITQTYSEYSKMLKYTVYYFEIPLNAGEYALGSCSDYNGAVLLYLDIGSNGDEGGGSGESDPTETTMSATAQQYVYPKGVDFLASADIPLEDIKNSAAIRLPSGTTGETSFTRDENIITVISAGNAPEASYIKDGVTVKIGDTEATATEVTAIPKEETVYLRKVSQTADGKTTVDIYKGDEPPNETASNIEELVISFTYTASAPMSITYDLDMPDGSSTWNLIIASTVEFTDIEEGASGFDVTIEYVSGNSSTASLNYGYSTPSPAEIPAETPSSTYTDTSYGFLGADELNLNTDATDLPLDRTVNVFIGNVLLDSSAMPGTLTVTDEETVYDLAPPGGTPLIYVDYLPDEETPGTISLSYTAETGEEPVGFVNSSGELVPFQLLEDASILDLGGGQFKVSFPATYANLMLSCYCAADEYGGILSAEDLKAADESAPGVFLLIPACTEGSVRIDSLALRFAGENGTELQCRCPDGSTWNADMVISYSQPEGTSTDLSIKQEDGSVVITTDRPDALFLSTMSEIAYNVVDSAPAEDEDAEESEDLPENTEDPADTEAPSESSDPADVPEEPDGTESDGTAETSDPVAGEETGSSEEPSDGGEAAQSEPTSVVEPDP